MTRTIALAAAMAVVVTAGAAARNETTLSVPGRSNANASIAAAGTFVVVTWAATGEHGTGIYTAASLDAGRTFAAPVAVSRTAGADVSGEQPPRVALVPRAGRAPAVVVVWTAKSASGTRLLTARSEDGGTRFSPPSPVPGSEAAGNRGWESMAVTPAGDAVAVWLDHRELTGGSGAMDHAGHHGTADGADRAQRSKLFFGPVSGKGTARAVAGGVCYCCKTALAVGPDGQVYAAWRHVYPGNVRDIAFTTSSDGGTTFAAPVRVSDDRWVLDGCPENGPALAVDARRRVHVVWPTLVPPSSPSREASLELFHAMSSDGRRFTARQRIPSSGVARHPQLAIAAGGDLVVVWDEPAAGRRAIAMARGTVDRAGAVSFTRQTIDDGSSATYPAVAVTREGPLVAWTSGTAASPSVIRVARIAP